MNPHSLPYPSLLYHYHREYDAAIRADVSEHLQKYITHYRKPAQSDDPYVFMSSKGQSLTAYNVGQLFQEIKKRAGITGAGLSVHSFRSTFNAQLLRSFKQS